MRKVLLIVTLLCGFLHTAEAQHFAIKTNSLYWAVLAPNVGIEFGVGRNMTMDLSGVYKPWNLRNDNDARLWLVQPELRYWLCEPFEGHFFGVHLHGAQYYAYFNQKIYDGYLAGGGITYGYDWILSPHWNLEALIGIGYARLWYKQRPNLPCAKCFSNKTENYFGPTKLALTVTYLF